MFLEDSPLNNMTILVVDDEPDILDTVEEELNMCLVHKAGDYETALQYILSYTYDIVILDIMGVDGFKLLKVSVSRDFPTVMLTAYALTPEALKKSIELGAVFFLPKEKLPELTDYLEDIVQDEKPTWIRFFKSLGTYFNRHFGPDWREKDKFFKEFEESLMKSERDGDI